MKFNETIELTTDKTRRLIDEIRYEFKKGEGICERCGCIVELKTHSNEKCKIISEMRGYQQEVNEL